MTGSLEGLAYAAPLTRTLSDQVAQQLREAILDGRLKPGQRLVEHDIAQGMRMSRGPIRDALRVLENERLVVRNPHRGTFVAWLTLRDAEEIYSLRRALEGLALQYAIRDANDEQIDELDHIVDDMAKRRAAGYTQNQATDLDLEFHHVLCKISGHVRVLSAWEDLRAQVRLLILTHRIEQPLDFREIAEKWHRQVANEIRQRDLTIAQKTLDTHLAASFESVVKVIRQGKLAPPLEYGDEQH